MEVTFQSPRDAFSSPSILQQNEAEIKRGVTSGAVSVGAECGASLAPQKGTDTHAWPPYTSENVALRWHNSKFVVCAFLPHF